MASWDLTVGQEYMYRGLASSFVRKAGLKYMTIVGVHPMGTKAGDETPMPERVNTAAHFVRLVIGKDRMTFEGSDVTWETLEPELKKVPSRADTALELSIANEEITIGQQNKARGMCIGLVNDLGFKYLTETGVHALGSKGGDNSPATQPVQSK